MPRTHDVTLIGLVAAMFLTNLLLIGMIASYANRVTKNDYKYEILKEEYTRLIQGVRLDQDVRIGRVQEQLQGIQFTMNRRFGLIEDRKYLGLDK